MRPLTTRIEEYINSLNFDEIKQLIPKGQFNLLEECLPIYRTTLINFITEGYSSYISYLNEKTINTIEWINQNPDQIPDKFYNYSGEGELNIVYQTYANLKFSKSYEVINFFKYRGIREVFLTHFVEINRIEDTIMEIIKSGIIINAQFTLIIVDMMYDMRIARDLNAYFITHKIVDEYDGPKEFKECEITLLNMLRRRKSDLDKFTKKEKYADPLEALLAEVERNDDSPDKFLTNIYIQAQKGTIREDNNPLKELLKWYFMRILKYYTPLEIKKIFKPLFYILFENSTDGLLSEDQFKLQAEDNEKYDGYYNKYYNTRLDTLVGFREMK